MLLHAKAGEGTEEAGPHSGQTSLVHNSILFSCYTQMWVQTPSYQSAPGGHYQLELRLLETSLLAPDFGPKTDTSLFSTFKLKGVGSSVGGEKVEKTVFRNDEILDMDLPS